MILPTQYQEFIHKSRYARWIEEENRRESWDETVRRYMQFFYNHLDQGSSEYCLTEPEYDELESAILNLDVMPSMRCLMTAGKALARDNVAGYNCSYLPIDTPRAFDEAMYILMCGTGVGFSVERQYIGQMPSIPDQLVKSHTVIKVRDSKIGWAEALRQLIALLYAGVIPEWDVSGLRPAGAKLKTMGGRSSGPEPLVELFRFVIMIFEHAVGRKLNSLECHDIMCKLGDIVVVGGVRRAALISLSNLSDQRMRDAKTGQWWELNPQRALANNSIAFTETPEVGHFMKEWGSIYESQSGERGIFNRNAARMQAGTSGRRDTEYDFGTNPCSEIILRPRQLCNLSEAVIRPSDSIYTLKEKVRIATILGTMQSTLTNFRYLPKKWQNNCEEERLLGVSLTGIMDNSLTSDSSDKGFTADIFCELRNVVVETNKEWADRLKINVSTAATCVKPSGTASQLVLSGSGMHAWFAEYYLRGVRQDNKDPVTQFMKDSGFPWQPDVTKPDETTIFSFPIKAPKGAVCRDDRTAIQELEHWKLVQDHWCEHKPSVTITVRENEWPSVGAWVWDNFDNMSGVAFLPHTNHVYKQAPYQEIDRTKYEQMQNEMPTDVNWSFLAEYECEDNTTSLRELSCTANACELVGDG